MNEFLVGLDVGTTSSKAVVYTLDGATVSSARVATPWVGVAPDDSTGMPGTEMSGESLLASAVGAVSQALADAPGGQVLGLGVTSMAESGVLVGGNGRPVVPVIAWHDSRDLTEVAQLSDDLGADHFSARTGLPLRSQWSLTKHRWQRTQDAATDRGVRRFSVAEWVVRGLGGDAASDASLASRTGWLDLTAREWWPEALDWSGASASLFAPLVASGTALGRVTSDAGVPGLAGAVLTTAGHDHQAAALGAEAARPGDQLDSCGTAEALVRTVPAGLDPDDIVRLARGGVTVGWHVLEGHWALLGATEGGLVLQRILSVLGGPGALPEMDALALRSSPGVVSIGLDAASRVTIGGVGDGVTPGDLWRAALDEITDQIYTIHQSMTEAAGPHRRMIVTGGWSRSEALMRAKTSVFEHVMRSRVEEAGARGAALLAGCAAGVYAGPQDFPLIGSAQ